MMRCASRMMLMESGRDADRQCCEDADGGMLCRMSCVSHSSRLRALQIMLKASNSSCDHCGQLFWLQSNRNEACRISKAAAYGGRAEVLHHL